MLNLELEGRAEKWSCCSCMVGVGERRRGRLGKERGGRGVIPHLAKSPGGDGYEQMSLHQKYLFPSLVLSPV